jgi:hypothetical protein
MPSPPAVLPRPQLHHAQQRLGALQSSAAVAGNQAVGAQARLRASVRCLESLHALLKGAVEHSGAAPRVDGQVRGASKGLAGCGSRPRPYLRPAFWL